MTTRLTKIGLTDYRCFNTEQFLELRPLTLLYGKNNAGKSAVLRALAILERSVRPGASSAWDLGGVDGPGQGAGFRSFPWREKATKYFRVRLFWTDGAQEFQDVLEIEQTERFAPVHVRMVRPADGPRWKYHPTEGGETATLYDRDDDGVITEEQISWQGLLPAPGQHHALDALRERLLTLQGAVQWLHGGRVRAPRSLALSGACPKILKPDGSDAGVKIAMEQGELLPTVNEFYTRVGRELRVDEGAWDDDARLLLDVEGQEMMKIGLSEVGEGMGKVLPVLVAAAAAAFGTGPHIVAVEDPDVHLHDDTERHLAEYLCELIDSHPHLTIVAETHSQTFLMAVQNQVRLRLSPAKVGVVWAQSEGDGSTLLTPIQLSAGGLPLTPELQTAFQEDARLGALLAGLED